MFTKGGEKPKKKFAISYSRRSKFKNCPLQYDIVTNHGVKEPQNDAMARGSEIHETLEAAFNLGLSANELQDRGFECVNKIKDFWDDTVMGLYPNSKKWENSKAEESACFDRDWGKLSWFDPNAWTRVKFDLNMYDGKEAMIIDWKTGRFRGTGYTDQLKLYALAIFKMYPHIERIDCKLVFVDTGDIYQNQIDSIFSRSQLPRLEDWWHKEAYEVENFKFFTDDEYLIYESLLEDKEQRGEQHDKVRVKAQTMCNITPLCDWCYLKKTDKCLVKLR